MGRKVLARSFLLLLDGFILRRGRPLVHLRGLNDASQLANALTGLSESLEQSRQRGPL